MEKRFENFSDKEIFYLLDCLEFVTTNESDETEADFISRHKMTYWEAVSLTEEVRKEFKRRGLKY